MLFVRKGFMRELKILKREMTPLAQSILTPLLEDTLLIYNYPDQGTCQTNKPLKFTT